MVSNHRHEKRMMEEEQKTEESAPISMKEQFRLWRKRSDCCHFPVCTSILDYHSISHSTIFTFKFKRSSVFLMSVGVF